VFKSLTLYGLLDFRLDVYHGDNDRVIRCGIFQTCKDYYSPRSATEAAEFQSGLAVTSYAVQPASFAKLREISASWQVPASWTRAIGASAASITRVRAGTSLPGATGPRSIRRPSGSPTSSTRATRRSRRKLAQFVTSIRLTF
jgi:hypothetical protein